MKELLSGYLSIALYIIVLVPGIFFVRMKTKIADEVYRKILHFILLGIIPIWLYVYNHWLVAVLACIGIIILLFPVLALAENIRWCSRFLIERNKGEFKSSLVLVFLMLAIVIAICWGVFDDKWLALTSIYAWGPGDAAAALIGKRFGKHKIMFHSVAGKKSYEGTAAMFMTSFIFVFGLLLIQGGINPWNYFIVSLMTAFVSSIIELFSTNGNDTVTCPIGAMATLIFTLQILGGI